ncbi:chemokine XC receptor 1-like [Xyrichtys novacula]|uniref:Chemokine XC receptor 1-like n=1 Tax=Xyrichtys novacula TaxID=13765 RepID=A0AAV1GGY0_XYRNO|nr:chemokine XC receptor 1-like [Xyrichtys novacula]
MTVDRFTAVVMHNFHINPATRRICVMVSCAAAWIISIAASMVDAVKVGVSPSWNGDFMCDYQSEDHSEDHSDFDLGYYLQIALLFFLPFAIIVFCYCAILKTVLQASNRKSRRTVVVIFCIVTAFFLCWGPYHILILISSFYIPKGCNAASHLDMAYEICRILAYSHCCMNPFLYLLSQKLRSHFLQLLHCRKYSKKSGERGQSTSGTQHVAFAAQNSTVMLEASFK